MEFSESEYNTLITCLDKDEENSTHQFYYFIVESEEVVEVEDFEENVRKKWNFRVAPLNRRARDWYDFVITEINDTTGKVTGMNNRNMEEYKGKGITEKMIEVAANVLGLTIISSTNNPAEKIFPNEWRAPTATTIWDRLVAKDKATYNRQTDIYTFIGTSEP